MTTSEQSRKDAVWTAYPYGDLGIYWWAINDAEGEVCAHLHRSRRAAEQCAARLQAEAPRG